MLVTLVILTEASHFIMGASLASEVGNCTLTEAAFLFVIETIRKMEHCKPDRKQCAILFVSIIYAVRVVRHCLDGLTVIEAILTKQCLTS